MYFFNKKGRKTGARHALTLKLDHVVISFLCMYVPPSDDERRDKWRGTMSCLAATQLDMYVRKKP